MSVRVEVCVTSLAEALAAEGAGVDTIEVCGWLACGGITPSFGLLNLMQERVRVRKRILVRPNPGSFRYVADDRQVLLRDVMMSGVGDRDCGIVCGALGADALPDVDLTRAMRLAAAGRELTFHRAIDRSADPVRALEMIMLLDIQRVLTSGGASGAREGTAVIAEMVRHAEGALIIAAAGGIAPGNVVELVERTGVREVHFSAQMPRAGGDRFDVDPDVGKIDGVLNALAKAGLR